MGLLTFAGRIILVVLNIFFLIAALALIVVGFIIKFANQYVQPLVQDALTLIESKTKTLYDSSYSLGNFEYTEVLNDLAIAMIVAGVVLGAVALVGCIGACCNLTTLALVYAIVLIAIFLAQVTLIILVYAVPGKVLKKYINEQLVTTLDGYQGLKATDTKSIGWNYAMQQFDCCGANDYTDFTSRTTWKAYDETNGITDLITPVACCKTLPEDSTAAAKCAGKNSDTNYDSTSEIQSESNLFTGCTDGIWDSVINENNARFIPVIVVVLICQLVLIIFAILIFKNRGITGGLV
ncbi:tetraspanin-1-like [Mya arenaria]|uniref:tetraspanin-1-like n=1 Tax=Mya arenaria TaxID=6604 RepID=UPI0022E6E22C|nr:tetraspanin-1-like [Mya arenaria]